MGGGASAVVATVGPDDGSQKAVGTGVMAVASVSSSWGEGGALWDRKPQQVTGFLDSKNGWC